MEAEGKKVTYLSEGVLKCLSWRGVLFSKLLELGFGPCNENGGQNS